MLCRSEHRHAGNIMLCEWLYSSRCQVFYFGGPCCVDLGRATMGVLAKIHSHIVILLKLWKWTDTLGQTRLKCSTGDAELLPCRCLASGFWHPFSFPHITLCLSGITDISPIDDFANKMRHCSESHVTRTGIEFLIIPTLWTTAPYPPHTLHINFIFELKCKKSTRRNKKEPYINANLGILLSVFISQDTS